MDKTNTKSTRPKKPDSPASDDCQERDANITILIKLGMAMTIQIEGSSCTKITEALKDFKALNSTLEEMFHDLTLRVYPKNGDPLCEVPTGED